MILQISEAVRKQEAAEAEVEATKVCAEKAAQLSAQEATLSAEVLGLRAALLEARERAALQEDALQATVAQLSSQVCCQCLQSVPSQLPLLLCFQNPEPSASSSHRTILGWAMKIEGSKTLGLSVTCPTKASRASAAVKMVLPQPDLSLQ